MIKIPGKEADSDDLGRIYDEEFFRLHANNMPAFKELSRLIDEVNECRHDRSILDIGCGHGFLVESLRQRGYQECYGLEGSPSAQAVWPEQYLSCYTLQNITANDSLQAARITNIVCSFETGEHIEQRYAKQYIQLLTQHRPEMIFFSAATVLQDCGKNPTHVNEQPLLYWIDHFHEKLYELDILNTVRIRNSMFEKSAIFNNAWWYPKNILIFRPVRTVLKEEDEKIAALANSRIRWFENRTAPNKLFAMCLMRDRHEYHYIIMDAVAKSVSRLFKCAGNIES